MGTVTKKDIALGWFLKGLQWLLSDKVKTKNKVLIVVGIIAVLFMAFNFKPPVCTDKNGDTMINVSDFKNEVIDILFDVGVAKQTIESVPREGVDFNSGSYKPVHLLSDVNNTNTEETVDTLELPVITVVQEVDFSNIKFGISKKYYPTFKKKIDCVSSCRTKVRDYIIADSVNFLKHGGYVLNEYNVLAVINKGKTGFKRSMAI